MVGLLLGVFAWRVAALAQDHAGLFYDELYYYHWSLRPDFGYYSKPPGIAWLITGGTTLLGHGYWGIKAGPLLAWLGTALVVWRIGRDFLDPATGRAAALLAYTAPVAGFYSLFATTDAVLLLCWSTALWLFLHARRSDALLPWIGTGVVTGLGLLGKYTMVLVPLAFLASLLSDPTGRARLHGAGPWLGAVVAGLVFAPNVVWNLTHGAIAWRHTAEISQLGSGAAGLHPGHLGAFLLAQVGLFGPVTVALLLVGSPIAARAARTDPVLRAVGLAGLAILVPICAQALVTRAFANWAAPALVTVAVVAGWLLRRRFRLVLAACAFNLALLGALMHWPLLLEAAGRSPAPGNDPWQRLAGWDVAARDVRACLGRDRDPSSFVVASDSREVLAQLLFRLRPGSDAFAFWQADPRRVENWYDQLANLRRFSSAPEPPFLLLSTGLDDRTIGAAFAQVEPLCELRDYRGRGSGEVLRVRIARGFLAYPEPSAP
jgi:4-amino-4-deoxy-L-arabinose transferase-like glycosyltransferase